MPYSGPASAYAQAGFAEKAYFSMINKKGGVNGRKIIFISRDDGYNPVKTVEQTRRLIKSDGVLFIFSSLGTSTNNAIHRYLNKLQIPQLLILTGASKWNQPKKYPWTTAFIPSFATEATSQGKFVRENYPNAKIGILFQNDDYGKDYLKYFIKGLGSTNNIVSQQSYNVTAPSISSQIFNLKHKGTTLVYNISTPKFATQAIKKIADLNWKPVHIINSISSSIDTVLKPAGLKNAKGLISSTALKINFSVPSHKEATTAEYEAFMKNNFPKEDPGNINFTYGYLNAKIMTYILEKCGDNLTRKNLLQQATNLSIHYPLMLPGIKFIITPENYQGFNSMVMVQFNGEKWVPLKRQNQSN